MLKIKLSRTGKKNQAQYRVVVAEAKSKRDGKSVDQIGIYHPQQSTPVTNIDLDKYTNWIKKGAQPTPTVRALAEKQRQLSTK